MPINANDRSATSTRRLGLLLLDGFSFMSYAATTEPFRAANTLAGAPLYQWTHVSHGGEPATASNGARIIADTALSAASHFDLVVVFAGGDPASIDHPRTLAWLRQQGASRAILAGVSAGPYILAKAGLLNEHRATIHWEHADAFRDAFPRVTLETGLYVIDRARITCAGGTAGLDLGIELVERDHGHALARRVGEWFIRTEARQAEGPQRQSLRERYDVSDDRVLLVLAAMERNIETPLSRPDLARLAGVSVRQLERLFLRQLGGALSASYLAIRTDQAARMLRTTGESVTSVGLACGFASPSHFSRVFKARHGLAPQALRRR